MSYSGFSIARQTASGVYLPSPVKSSIAVKFCGREIHTSRRTSIPLTRTIPCKKNRSVRRRRGCPDEVVRFVASSLLIKRERMPCFVVTVDFNATWAQHLSPLASYVTRKRRIDIPRLFLLKNVCILSEL